MRKLWIKIHKNQIKSPLYEVSTVFLETLHSIEQQSIHMKLFQNVQGMISVDDLHSHTGYILISKG